MRISAAKGEDGTAILDLYHWLRRDADVNRHADLTLVAPDGCGGSMGAVEVIELVVGQGFAAANLALAYVSWRTARPAAPALTITANGRSVTVEGPVSDAADTVRRIVEVLDAAPAPVPADARESASEEA